MTYSGRLWQFVATVGYAGYFPVAPGTAGSAVGVLLDLILRTTVSPVVHGVSILMISWLGVLAASAVEKDLKRKDPSIVVVDELAGMLIALYLLPLSLIGMVMGFLIFRILDIVKPYPCNLLEGLPSGIGIMADDIMAGVYTQLLLRLAVWAWPVVMVAQA